MEAGIYVQEQLKNYDHPGKGVGYVYEPRVVCGMCHTNVGNNERCSHCGNIIIIKIPRYPPIVRAGKV